MSEYDDILDTTQSDDLFDSYFNVCFIIKIKSIHSF